MSLRANSLWIIVPPRSITVFSIDLLYFYYNVVTTVSILFEALLLLILSWSILCSCSETLFEPVDFPLLHLDWWVDWRTTGTMVFFPTFKDLGKKNNHKNQRVVIKGQHLCYLMHETFSWATLRQPRSKQCHLSGN